MKNLLTIKIISNKIYFFSLILLIISSNVLGLENKIIFKINDKAFTSLDYEKRVKYLDFVGNNNNLTKDIVLDDFISANLFFEYYLKNKNNEDYSSKVNELFNEILEINNKNNKVFEYKIDKTNILSNLEKDLIRKNILENILNSNINNLEISKEEIDLLYNFKIKYLNLDNENYFKIKKKFSNIDNLNIEEIILFLEENNIEYFLKEREIDDLNKIDPKIKEQILLKNNFFVIEKNNNVSFIYIDRRFETLNGIIVNLYSIQTNNIIDEENLLCSNLINKTNEINIINKEYKLVNLNNQLKEKLININDYVYISNEESKNIYIVLCDIKFDKELLNNINFNKLINSNAKDIENNFIKKYSKIYNLIILNV